MNNDVMDNELRDLEDQLGKLSPVAMPEDMLARMEQAMERWNEFTPAEEKIVQFQSHAEAHSSSKFPIWATAAAITLIGAVTAVLLMPEKSVQDGNVIASAPTPAPAADVVPQVAPDRLPSNIVGVNHSKFDTKITDEPSYSITYDSEGKPHRLVKVRFEDEITVYDDKGQPVKIRKPRVEYYMVPLQVR